jgi:hypothetical protein
MHARAGAARSRGRRSRSARGVPLFEACASLVARAIAGAQYNTLSKVQLYLRYTEKATALLCRQYILKI